MTRKVGWVEVGKEGIEEEKRVEKKKEKKEKDKDEDYCKEKKTYV